jgi:uncharacterized protein YPO0396
VRRLKGIRLVNWYHFVDQTFRFEGSCLLFGDNGSGKSTVLDAVQMALVADQAQVRFNKAANEHGRRTLYGYVRYKLGSEDEARPGQQRFGRGSCTSCIALEFEDDRDPAAAFVCGIVMEARESDTNNVDRFHFILPRGRVEDVPIVDGDNVRSLRDFANAWRDVPFVKANTDVGTYREEVRHRLGALPESFHRLIVKALDFRPIGRVRDFVLHYLLDERPVDTASLQANLEHYKKLEAQAKDAERRLDSLEKICVVGARLAQERASAEGHQFLTLRAQVELEEGNVAEVKIKAGNATREREQAERELARIEEQQGFYERRREELNDRLRGTPGYQQLRALEQEYEETERAASEAQGSGVRARGILLAQVRALDRLVAPQARDLVQRYPDVLRSGVLVGAAAEPSEATALRRAQAGKGTVSSQDIKGWLEHLEQAVQAIGVAVQLMGRRGAELQSEHTALQAEQTELRKGRVRYPDGTAALLHLLAAKLRGRPQAKPLCELIDITDDRWRDTVEGYLGQRRFDIIVSPEDFTRALRLYERHKVDYALPGRGEVFIAGTGLVDMPRVEGAKRTAQRRSLAEHVTTDEPLAQIYLDYLLGDVICCDREDELRNHRIAVTPTVMVYEGHAARQVDPNVYRDHFIGAAARMRRLDAIERRLGDLASSHQILLDDIKSIKDLEKTCVAAKASVSEVQKLVSEALRLPDLTARLEVLRRDIGRVDQSEVEPLKQDLRDVVKELVELGKSHKSNTGTVAARSSDEARLVGERTKADNALGAAWEKLKESFDEAQRGRHEPNYLRERRSREAREIHGASERQHRSVDAKANKTTQELVKLKTDHGNAHGFVADPLGEGYLEFDAELTLWKESRLPEYRERIVHAKEEAIQQLAEDIIFRLRQNLVDVKRHIDELNRALKDVPFGTERYEFVTEVSEGHRRFYDLIMAAGDFEKGSLFGKAALADTNARRTLDELVERLIQAEAKAVKTDLEERADYREYFVYDLKITHADGTWSSYDRVAGDKSGGETQNPYYVAIFASMHRLYRTMSADGKPTCSLVLLDEAFSKMDEPRIAATLQLARALGLQLVLATPKERAELLAPFVEACLYVHRDPMSGSPEVFDFTKDFAPDASDAT